MYVTDTHAFLWFLSEDRRLGKEANKAFVSCDNGTDIIVIPTIALMESIFICENKRLSLGFDKVLEKLSQYPLNYRIYPLDMRVIMKCKEIPELRHPHDRIITATSITLNATLITKDKIIQDSKLVNTIW